MKPKWIILWLFLAAVSNTAFGQRIIYVDADATGAKNGSSWIDAYKYLQDALSDANSSTKPVEIRVAQGVYRPDESSAEPNGTGNRGATFQLINRVTLKGGYAGYGEPDPNARDINKYKTILSGDLDANDTGPSDWKSQMIDVFDSSGWQLIDDLIRWGPRKDNSYTVVTGSGTDNTAVLDGFIITAGQADGLGGVADGDGPEANGAGMYNRDGNPTILNCTFLRNTTCGYDRRTKGAGMFNFNSSPVLRNCRFIENIAFGANGTAMGGGMFDTNSAPILTGCAFIDNLVTGFDADYYGGAVYDYQSNPVFTDCSFTHNHSELATFCSEENGIAKLERCLFAGNGGAIHLYGGYLDLLNCTFAGHWNAISCDSWERTNSLKAVNCIFWDNKDGAVGGLWSEIQIIFSDIQGGWDGEGNISVDPCFAQTGYWSDNGTPDDRWDDFWVDGDGDYHLKSQAGRYDPNIKGWVKGNVTSLCIDAGDPASPIGLEPFPNGGIINMGAYGGTAEASKSYFGKPVCEVIVAGDINGDCKVDFWDLALMTSHWLE